MSLFFWLSFFKKNKKNKKRKDGNNKTREGCVEGVMDGVRVDVDLVGVGVCFIIRLPPRLKQLTLDLWCVCVCRKYTLLIITTGAIGCGCVWAQHSTQINCGIYYLTFNVSTPPPS